MEGTRIGFGLTGSFCTIPMIFKEIENLCMMGASVMPIVSYHVNSMDTRFGTAEDTKARLKEITGHDVISTIDGAEPIGPNKLLDLMIVAPCTGNTLAKMANGITDTPVLMAVKSHLRNDRPVLLCIASNDSLGVNAKNIGMLLGRKNIYFVPFGQDGIAVKHCSMQSKFSLLPSAALAALSRTQLQPLLLSAGECLKGE